MRVDIGPVRFRLGPLTQGRHRASGLRRVTGVSLPSRTKLLLTRGSYYSKYSVQLVLVDPKEGSGQSMACRPLAYDHSSPTSAMCPTTIGAFCSPQIWGLPTGVAAQNKPTNLDMV